MKWPNRIESEAEAETETREDLARQLPEPA
jgi:hypothetical protein